MKTGAPDLTNAALTRRLVALAWSFRADCVLLLVLQLTLLILGVLGLKFLGLGIDVMRHALDPDERAPAWPFGFHPPASWTALEQVALLAGAIVAFACVRAGLTFFHTMVGARLTQGKIVPTLRERVYAKLQRLGFRFYDEQASGAIFNRVTGDVQNTRLFVDGVILQAIIMVLSLGVYLTYMLQIHVALTLACLGTTPLLWWVSSHFSRRLRPAYVRNRELMDDLVLSFSESVRGMQTIKSFAAEQVQDSAFGQRNKSVRDQQRSIFRDISTFTPLTGFLTQLNLVILLGFGGFLFVEGEIALGSGLVVFAGLLQQFSGQIANISGIANSIQQSLTAARRVFEVLDAPLEVESRAGAVAPTRVKGHVVFDRVSFAYRAGEPVLREISFEVKPGQVVGIFGATGSGKTTLLSLIPRFYDAQSGSIRIDGYDVRDLELDALRRQIGLVYQESFLFSNTVAANIAFGNPRATQGQIEWAARIAAAHDFIVRLPRGYESVLGESGCDLSGGQRQRLALARALLLEPPILLLDDPTAAVDARTEHEIVDALRGAMAGRTTFVVANRLSLLRQADRILVLEHGRLVDAGTHDELVGRDGPYRRTAALQLMDLAAGKEGAS